MIKIRIRDLRVDRDWTQREIFSPLQISRITYSAYENDATTPSLETSVNLSRPYEDSVNSRLFLPNQPLSLEKRVLTHAKE